MRRLGALLMIIGANLVVGALAVGFYVAAVGCAVAAADGMCAQGSLGLYAGLMTSKAGLPFWLAIVAGVVLFWRGKRLRAGEPRAKADVKT